MNNETSWLARRVLVALAHLMVVLVCSLGLLPSVSAQTIPAPQYPLKLTAGKTHLIDQNNRPFFINGDTAWSLVVNTTQAEATQYLQDRAAKGYNAIIVNLIDPAFGENVPNNLAGDPPFTTPNNFTTPGTAYWNHVDWVLSEAAANGIVVFAHPLYLGVGCGAEGWCQAVKDSPVAAMTTYGEFLGQRYANQPNIVWVIGADANPVAEGVESKVMAMVNGIKTYDSVHLMTAHNFQQSAIAPAWADNSWIDLNTIYTYSNTHQVTLDEYNRADTRPIFLQETRYEREFGATDLEVRRQAWWAVLSGAQLGHFFGNCPIWGFDNVMGICSAPGGGWQGQLNSTLSNDLSYVGKLFASRAFHLLIPDQTSSVMTAGVQSGATKATTARATDGSSVIAYIPTSRQVTIDMTKVAGSQGHAWWFNPRDASTIDLGTFDTTGTRNFTPPDANDWVLVIDNASLSLPAPGNGATPDSQAPTAPGDLTAVASSGGQINLAWTAATDNIAVAGYMVERCQGAGCTSFALIATPAVNSHSDTGLAAGTSYSYRVRAVDGAGNFSQDYSNVASASTPSTPSGLVAAYSFNEGTGTTVADASGNGNSGVLTAATWTTQGRFGNALVFNGTTARVAVPDSASLDLSTAMTLQAWVYPTAAVNPYSTVLLKEQAIDLVYALYARSQANLPEAYYNVSTTASGERGVTGPSALPLNTWSHLATTYDGATLRLFVNGIQVASQARTGTIVQSGGALSIGNNTVWSGESFAGRIDEIRIYNRALSAAEIQSDMNTAVNPAPAPGLDVTPPGNVSGLSATPVGVAQINLSWSAATDNVGVAGYRVERCAGVGCNTFVEITTLTATIFSDTGVAAGTGYSYRVRAVDTAGNLGTYSNIASATTPVSDVTPPGAPSGLVATATSTTQIDLSWIASTDNIGVTGYRVERCQGATCTAFIEIAAPVGTNLSSIGLAAGTTYRFRVRAADAAGNSSAYSNIASAATQVADTTRPSAPTGLAAMVVSSNQVNLSWNASTDNVGVSGYRVLRCQGAGCTNFVQVATSTVTSFSDTGLAAATTYRYRIRAFDAAGNVSTNSNTVSAVTQAAADLISPSAPAGLIGTAAGATQINLSWAPATDNVGVTGYQVERCQGASCTNFVQVATPATTSYSDTGLTATTTYRYRVRATDAAGNLGPYSSIASVATPAAPDTTLPSAPTGLGATAAGATQINLSWAPATDNVGVTGYQVERCQGASCTSFVQVATPATTSYSDIGLTAATTYRYRVRATDATGNLGPYSSIASAATQVAPDTTLPSAPTGLGATAGGATQINLSWAPATDNVGVTGYQVERCQGASCTSFVQVATPATTSYSDTGLTAATTYRYRVRATDATGNLGPYSSIAFVATQAAPDTTPPGAPLGLLAIAASSTEITLIWTAPTDNVGVTAYRVERCQGAGCSTFVQIATSTITSYNDTGLSANMSYSYRVLATDAAGNLGPYSSIASVATQTPDTTAPTAPTGLSATAAGSAQINLAWAAATDDVAVTGYRVERCQGANCTSFSQVGTVPGTATTYNDTTGLVANTSYGYRVRATDSVPNLGPYSNVARTTSLGAAGLVAAYAFNEGAGTTVADASGNGNNGVLTSATWTTQGRFGNALVFSGTNARVAVPDSASLDLRTAMTLQAWVYPTAAANPYTTVLLKEQATDLVYALYARSPANLPEAYYNVSTTASGERGVTGLSALPLNTWSHLATTYDGATLRLYVNGIQVASQARTGTIVQSGGALSIGNNTVWSGESFTGRIDEIRIYNRALTQAEIQADMASPVQ